MDKGLKHLSTDSPQGFLRLIEKRVRRHIRLHTPLKKGQRLLCIMDGSASAVVAYDLLMRITKPIPEVIIDTAHEFMEGYEYVFYPVSATTRAGLLLKKIVSGEDVDAVDSVVSCLSEQEIEHYAKLRQLEYRDVGVDSAVSAVRRFESYYPGSTFGFVKSLHQIENYEKK